MAARTLSVLARGSPILGEVGGVSGANRYGRAGGIRPGSGGLVRGREPRTHKTGLDSDGCRVIGLPSPGWVHPQAPGAHPWKTTPCTRPFTPLSSILRRTVRTCSTISHVSRLRLGDDYGKKRPVEQWEGGGPGGALVGVAVLQVFCFRRGEGKRAHRRPSLPVAQKVHPMAHPTCEQEGTILGTDRK